MPSKTSASLPDNTLAAVGTTWLESSARGIPMVSRRIADKRSANNQQALRDRWDRAIHLAALAVPSAPISQLAVPGLF